MNHFYGARNVAATIAAVILGVFSYNEFQRPAYRTVTMTDASFTMEIPDDWTVARSPGLMSGQAWTQPWFLTWSPGGETIACGTFSVFEDERVANSWEQSFRNPIMSPLTPPDMPVIKRQICPKAALEDVIPAILPKIGAGAFVDVRVLQKLRVSAPSMGAGVIDMKAAWIHYKYALRGTKLDSYLRLVIAPALARHNTIPMEGVALVYYTSPSESYKRFMDQMMQSNDQTMEYLRRLTGQQVPAQGLSATTAWIGHTGTIQIFRAEAPENLFKGNLATYFHVLNSMKVNHEVLQAYSNANIQFVNNVQNSTHEMALQFERSMRESSRQFEKAMEALAK